MITLTRFPGVSRTGTTGIINMHGKLYYTMEQPWMDNTPFKSCIPIGAYELVVWNSSKYGACFVAVNEGLNVYHSQESEGRPDNGRYKCLFVHRGNYAHNFQGCCGAGQDYLVGEDMITATRSTCLTLNQAIEDEGSNVLLIQNG